MRKIRVSALGKINLSLNILGRQNNMHLIDSVMQSVDFGDTVTVMQRLDDKVRIFFLGTDAVDSKNNTVKKTVDILRAQFGDFGADIVVEKNLPLSGGMGGSSADAAATLTALNLLFDLDKRGLDILSTAAQIGSDVPFMLSGGCARVTGTGDIITAAENNTQLHLVIAHRGAGVNSASAYAEFDNIYKDYKLVLCDNNKLLSSLYLGDIQALNLFSNALEPASVRLCESIVGTKQALIDEGAITAVMTGSGSSVVGYFLDADTAALAAKRLRIKKFWAKNCNFSNHGLQIS